MNKEGIKKGGYEEPEETGLFHEGVDFGFQLEKDLVEAIEEANLLVFVDTLKKLLREPSEEELISFKEKYNLKHSEIDFETLDRLLEENRIEIERLKKQHQKERDDMSKLGKII